MNQLVNPSIVLDNHPQGAATTSNFRIANQPIRQLKAGEFLIENIWLSMDPYTRPRLNENTAYVEPIKLGQVIQGETIGKVVESNSPKYQVGDSVFTFSGWQKYCIANDADFYDVSIAGHAAAANDLFECSRHSGSSRVFWFE